MTGTSQPEEPDLPGRSFLSLLEKPAKTLPEKPHFAQHHRLRCIRTTDWKYVLSCIDDEPDELYDLKHDSHEHVNLISRIEEPEVNRVYTDLKQKLMLHMQRISDPLWDKML
jgi:arylsulfatase A-like enzyme